MAHESISGETPEMRRLLSVAIVAAVCLAASAANAQTVVMRISHQVPTAHHLHKMLLNFQQYAKESSRGEVDVQLYPAEQLHKAAEHHAAVARGVVEGALSVNQQWGNTIPEMNVVVIPFLFSDLDKIRKFPGSEAAKLLDRKLEEKGVKNIAWFYITRLAIYTSAKKAIVAPEDFKGLKIRGFNRIADAGLEKLGAAPSAMPGPEVYNALQTGVLDAGLTDLSAAYSRRFYEVQKFGTVSPSLTVYFHLYVNPRWWAGLKPEHRAALETAAAKAEKDAIAITEETAAAAEKQLRERGMTLHMQTPAEIDQWRKAMQPAVMDAFLKAAPQDGQKLIDLLQKL
jgi:TRAP-type C4-dicarboxylate transport system substrate-binding protein